VILVDVNLLVYAHMEDSPQFEAARSWLDGQLNGYGRVGLPWPCLTGFLRLVTNPRVYRRPESVESAWTTVHEWISLPNVWIPTPTARHAEVLARLLPESGGGNHVQDAHLAAPAIEHGLVLCSTDRDFSRYRELKWQNPLDPSES
jgi:uncharacterized protein